MADILSVLLQASREAGTAILALQNSGFTIEKKANNDIVTQADLLANEILQTRLTTHFPEIGWLSEESVDDQSRLQCERVWIVDPIDGTREFANNIPEYALSIALVEQGEPVLSVVFNPATNEFFHAVKNQGAWLNNQRIYCQQVSPARLLLLASRSEYKRGEWVPFETQHEVKVIGSIAYKLALIAAGRGAATFSLGPKNEWDIAAGVLLVSEAGGIVTNKSQEKLLFNQKNVKINGIVATAANVNERIFALIRQYA